MESEWRDDVWQVPRVSRWRLSACVFSVFRDSVYTGFTPIIMSGAGNDKNACTSTLRPSASAWGAGGSLCTWLQLHKRISLNTNYVCASLSVPRPQVWMWQGRRNHLRTRAFYFASTAPESVSVLMNYTRRLVATQVCVIRHLWHVLWLGVDV